MAYTPVNKLKTDAAVVPASSTDRQVSGDFGLTELQSRYLRVDVQVSSVTAGGIVFNLQHRSPSSGWETIKTSATITTAGTVVFLVNPETDDSIVPLRSQARVIVTTTTGDLTVDSVHVYQS